MSALEIINGKSSIPCELRGYSLDAKRRLVLPYPINPRVARIFWRGLETNKEIYQRTGQDHA